MSMKHIEKQLEKLKEKEELSEDDKNWIAFMKIQMTDKVFRIIHEVLNDLLEQIIEIREYIRMDEKDDK